MYRARLERELANWRTGADIDPAVVEGAIDDELPGLLERIAADAPGDAFAEFVAITSVLNAAVVIRASILEKITKHVEKLRDALAKIAQGLQADSFDISVSAPVGLSASLTFEVQPGR